MKLLFFAQLRQATGMAEAEWSLAEPLTADGLWELLLRQHPVLEPYRAITRLARNGEYVTPETRFSDTDEVALIPPVSGG